MIRRFFIWLLRIKPEIQIIEVDKPRPLGDVGDDAEKSIVTLAGHPGFQYLTGKLDLQRSALRSRLQQEHHNDLSQVMLLQSGIFWTGWLKAQLDKAVYSITTAKKTTQATSTELEAFQIAQNALEEIGGDS